MCRQQSNAHAAVPVTGSDRITDLLNSGFPHRNARMYPRSSCNEGLSAINATAMPTNHRGVSELPRPDAGACPACVAKEGPSHLDCVELAVYPGYGQTPGSTVSANHADKAVCLNKDRCTRAADWCNQCRMQITVVSGLRECSSSPFHAAEDSVSAVPSITWISSHGEVRCSYRRCQQQLGKSLSTACYQCSNM